MNVFTLPYRPVAFLRLGYFLPLALLLLFFGTGCQEAEVTPVIETQLPGKGFNLAIILVDTLRPDHLGCYGYKRATSANLDAIATQGVVFEDAQTASTYTGEAVTALFTGRPPAASPYGLGWSARPEPREESLPKILEAAGYKTGLFSTSFVMRFRGFYDNFQESELFPGVPNTSALDQDLTAAALDFASRHKEEPTFQYLHYYAPHAPYNPPEEQLRQFDIDRSVLDPADEVHPAALVSQGMAADDPRWEELKKHYDAEILLIDREIGRFLDGLRELGLDKNTIVVITSDHGEEFMEHGFADHAWNLYQETLRIPFIIWAPELLGAARIADPVSIVDVMPTVLRFLQVPHAPYPAEVGGTYLFAPGPSAWEYVPRTGPLYASLFPETRAQLHAVRFGNYKYLTGPRWLNAEACKRFWLLQGAMAGMAREADFLGVNPWGSAEVEVLFDLGADPSETNNLAGKDPKNLGIARDLMKRYREISEEVLETGPWLPSGDPFNDDVVRAMLKEMAGQDSDNKGAEDSEGQRLSPDLIEGLETMGYL